MLSALLLGLWKEYLELAESWLLPCLQQLFMARRFINGNTYVHYEGYIHQMFLCLDHIV